MRRAIGAMNTDLLSCVEVQPDGPVRTAVIWLHGLGADGHDFEPIVKYLPLGEELGTRFVFPHAPQRPVTINMGLIMRAWYDVRGLDFQRDEDLKGIRESAALVRALVAREIERGVPARRIVMAGFSQGGAIALHVGLRYPETFAGIMALSCYLVDAGSLADEISDANRGTSIFQAHGTEDPMVAFERGCASRDRLTGLALPVEWKSYPMGHEIHPQEIEDIGVWLSGQLSKALDGDSRPA
jgi:phospholipase/carboxylesterase